MLKPIKTTTILSVEDYIELFGKPREDFGEQDQLVLNRWIEQATQQFDSMVSPQGQSGRLFEFWNNLEDNEQDNLKGYKLQHAIGSWVETMVISGKYWVDNVPNMNSNISFNLSGSYEDSNIELKRKDIIQTLTAIGITATTNIAMNNKPQISDKEKEDLVVVSWKELQSKFLMLDSLSTQQYLKSDINFAERGIQNGGDIVNTNPAQHVIRNYRFQGCLIDGANNDIIATQTNKILDRKDQTYKFLDQFDIKYWDGLTKQEIFTAIASSDKVISADLSYQKGWVGVGLKDNNIYAWYESLIDDNIGNFPVKDFPNAWKELPIAPIDVALIEKYINEKLPPLVESEVDDKINKLATKEITTEANGEIIAFNNENDFETYKQANNIDDSYFENCETYTTLWYFEGQCLYFKNKTLADSFVNKYNLVENVDIEITKDLLPFGCGENGVIVGNGIISKDNIQKFNTNGHSHITTFGSVAWGAALITGKGEATSRIQKGRHNLSTDNVVDSVGVDRPVPFKPQYIERYEIVFLKDTSIKVKKEGN